MPFVEPTGVHQARQISNGRGTETQNLNGESSKPSTSANECCDSSTNIASGQGQQVSSNSNQSSNIATGFIQNRPQGTKNLKALFDP